MRKALEVTTGRHPFQVAIVAACPISGAFILITGYSPRSVQSSLPAGFVNVWLAALVVNGLIALVGAYWKRPLPFGLRMECGGIIGIGAMTTVYSAAIAVQSGLDAIAAGSLVTGIAVACWWRVGQIVRDIRRVTRAQSTGVLETRIVLTEPDPHDQGTP